MFIKKMSIHVTLNLTMKILRKYILPCYNNFDKLGFNFTISV